MATVTECDRCKAITEQGKCLSLWDTKLVGYVGPGVPTPFFEIDLCLGCSKEVVQWANLDTDVRLDNDKT